MPVWRPQDGRIQLRFAAFDRIKRSAHLAHLGRKLIYLASMLARQCAELEQPSFRFIECCRIMQKGFGSCAELVFSFTGLDQRSVKRRQGLCKQRMLTANPIKPTGGNTQTCKGRIRTLPDMAQFFQVAGKLLTLLHSRTRFREPRLFARLWLK